MDNATELESKQNQSSRSWVLAMMVMLIGAFMAILDSSIVNVAIPAMMNAFHTSMSRVQWVMTIYMLTLGVIVPTSGWLGDLWGFKKLYIYSLIVFTIGSALCTLAWSENVLIVARVIQALGGGMIMPTTMSMVYSVVPRERIGSAMGIFGLTMLVAPAIGPTLGGYLVEYVSWRWIFTINLPIGVAGILLAAAFLPEFPHKNASKFDVLGFITSSISLFCLLLALSQGQDWGWKSLPIVLLLYLSFAMMGVFIFHELTTPDPLLDLKVFKYPSFVLGNIMMVVITMSLNSRLFFIPFFLQEVRGLGALTVGLIMLPSALMGAVLLPIAGRMYDKFGPKVPVGLGTMFLVCATYLFTKIDINTSIKTIIEWNVVFSFGMGFTMMPLQTAILADIPQEQISRGSAITNVVSRVSGSFGIAVLTLALVNREAIHSAYLQWSFSAQNMGGLLSNSGLDKNTLFSLIMGRIAQDSFVLSLNDMFYITVITSICAFLMTFLLPNKGKSQNGKTSVMSE